MLEWRKAEERGSWCWPAVNSILILFLLTATIHQLIGGPLHRQAGRVLVQGQVAGQGLHIFTLEHGITWSVTWSWYFMKRGASCSTVIDKPEDQFEIRGLLWECPLEENPCGLSDWGNFGEKWHNKAAIMTGMDNNAWTQGAEVRLCRNFRVLLLSPEGYSSNAIS